MAITALRIVQSAQIEPSSLGAGIIDPTLEEGEEQEVAMLAWVGANVLPLAVAEVAVPWYTLTGYEAVEPWVEAAFLALPQSRKDAAKAIGSAQFDNAVLGFSDEMLNSGTDSNSESYDRDAVAARKVGEARLAKLLVWGRAMIASRGLPGSPIDDDATGRSVGFTSGSLDVELAW